MNKRKRFVIIPSVLIGLIAIIGFVMILTLQANMKEIQAIPIEQLKLEEIEDGTYIGEYYFEDQIGATLEVMVENHQIIDIHVIDHVYGKGQIAEALLLDIIATQTLDVDDVAGATTSSHVLKLSVQDALKEN